MDHHRHETAQTTPNAQQTKHIIQKQPRQKQIQKEITQQRYCERSGVWVWVWEGKRQAKGRRRRGPRLAMAWRGDGLGGMERYVSAGGVT